MIADVFAVSDGFSDRMAQHRASRKLTNDGLREVAVLGLKSFYGPKYRKAVARLAQLQGEANTLRASIRLPTPDPANVTAALLAQEIRTYLRGAGPVKATALAFSGNSAIRDAVLHAPPELSGIPADRHAALVAAFLQEQFQPQLAELAGLEELVDLAEVARRLARSAMGSAVGSLPADAGAFEAAMTEADKAPPPILIRDKRADGTEQILCWDPSTPNGARPATETEIEIGEFHLARAA
jgi:hypothetical protein